MKTSNKHNNTRAYAFYDSWIHYRHNVKYGWVKAIWRTIAYEILNWPDGIRPGKWKR